MRTRALPPHSGGENPADVAAAALAPASNDGAEEAAGRGERRPAQLEQAEQTEQTEQDWTRRRRTAAGYGPTTTAQDPDADDDLARSRTAAQRATAMRAANDRPAPRR